MKKEEIFDLNNKKEAGDTDLLLQILGVINSYQAEHGISLLAVLDTLMCVARELMIARGKVNQDRSKAVFGELWEAIEFSDRPDDIIWALTVLARSDLFMAFLEDAMNSNKPL